MTAWQTPGYLAQVLAEIHSHMSHIWLATEEEREHAAGILYVAHTGHPPAEQSS